jgi:hypothetical protein
VYHGPSILAQYAASNLVYLLVVMIFRETHWRRHDAARLLDSLVEWSGSE